LRCQTTWKRTPDRRRTGLDADHPENEVLIPRLNTPGFPGHGDRYDHLYDWHPMRANLASDAPSESIGRGALGVPRS
jgi:hypothetical protein